VNDDPPPGEAYVVIVIRAWHERHPDAPFRAAITIGTDIEGLERQTVASVDDALVVVRAGLTVVDYREGAQTRPIDTPNERPTAD